MEFTRFQALSAVAGLRHAVSHRNGGLSEAPYSSLNLGYHTGDNLECVTANRRLLASTLGYDAGALIAAQQVHGTGCQTVSASQRGSGAWEPETALPATDALIVSEKGLPVLIQVADCAPLLLVDPRQGVLAVVHAGWRGAAGRIASLTVAAMERQFQVHPGDLLCGIGPCLCPDCFEIGPEVAMAAGAVAPHSVVPAERPQLDLRRLLTDDLRAAGVPESRIEASPHCPSCEPESFFSHRGQHGITGRMGLVAWWE